MKKKQLVPWLWSHILPRATIGLLGIPALIYLQLMTSFFPWKQLALADILHPLPFKYPEYLQAVGLVLPIGGLGLFLAIRKRERQMILSISWVLAWAALLIVFSKIPQQSPLRFSEMIVHVPLGVLSVYLFKELFEVLKRWFEKKRFLKKFSIMHYALFILPISWIVLNLLHMYSSWFWQRDFVDHKIRAMYPLVPTGSYVMYPLKDFIGAIRWVQDHTSRETVILSQTTAGNYIPVYSGNTVYVGHENTVGKEEKLMFVRSFFSGTMPAADAKSWLTENKLSWIFFGPQEREEAAGKDLTYFYPFLEVAFKNNYVNVYQVK